MFIVFIMAAMIFSSPEDALSKQTALHMLEEKSEITNIVCEGDKKIAISIDNFNSQVQSRHAEIPIILKKFLGIDMGGFKEKDKNGNLEFAKEYGITIKGMTEIIKFLKFGKVEENKDCLEFLMEMFIRIGTCPEFDIFYNNYFNKKKIEQENKDKIYNPQNPSDDGKLKYTWNIFTPNPHDAPAKFEGWDVGDQVLRNNDKFYYRKLKIEN